MDSAGTGGKDILMGGADKELEHIPDEREDDIEEE